MAIIEVGRICVKTKGREAGQKCVILDIIDNNFVLVTGPKKVSGIKRRRTNLLHLEPTDKKIDISKGASDEEVEKKLQEAGLLDFVKEKVKIKILVI
ncbi:50S ribosomal protein L14e [Acidianus sp. RZ1]|uniref:50S ribosomal protein L14e n=1 Tax=Acidianus sp. RZ1 TaxID=1540082 RepID=UPI0014915AAC|nr:50S ribosomal protein L14e [Acidianus sp. RZ1]NON63553.1 50S ribosomal protein L14e [Acidianus sp. RZ1]